MMANELKLELNAVERAWIKQSLATQVKVLTRARSREMVGSEIYSLREKEIAQVSALIGRF